MLLCLISYKHYNMRIKTYLLIFCLVLSFNVIQGQRVSVWGTYAHSKFIHSPGIEAAVYIKPYIGLQAGINTYIAKVDRNQLTNYLEDTDYWYAYGGNLDLTSFILKDKKHRLALALGAKYYYGNYFVKHHYYAAKDYYIYYDIHRYKFDFGFDMGLAYYHDKTSVILKYDTARHFLRFGIGYSFGKL